MTAIIVLAGFGALAIGAIASSLLSIARDGYGRMPVRRPLREFERDEHYRA